MSRKKDNPTPKERKEQEEAFDRYTIARRAKKHENSTIEKKEKEMEEDDNP